MAAQVRANLAAKTLVFMAASANMPRLLPCLSVSPLHRVKGALRQAAKRPQPALDPATGLSRVGPRKPSMRPRDSRCPMRAEMDHDRHRHLNQIDPNNR